MPTGPQKIWKIWIDFPLQHDEADNDADDNDAKDPPMPLTAIQINTPLIQALLDHHPFLACNNDTAKLTPMANTLTTIHLMQAMTMPLMTPQMPSIMLATDTSFITASFKCMHHCNAILNCINQQLQPMTDHQLIAFTAAPSPTLSHNNATSPAKLPYPRPSPRQPLNAKPGHLRSPWHPGTGPATSSPRPISPWRQIPRSSQ